MMECYICGHDVKRDGYEYRCTVCGCKNGSIDTVEIIDKRTAAANKNFYLLMMSLLIDSSERGFIPDDESKRLYHLAKGLAEKYADLAGDTVSSEWTLDWLLRD